MAARELAAAVAAAQQQREKDKDKDKDGDQVVAAVDGLYLLRLREQIKQQFLEYSAVADAGTPAAADDAAREMSVLNAIEDCKKDIEKEKASFWNKTLALQRIQLMAAVRDQMKLNDNDSQLLLKTLQDIVRLSQAVVAYQQQARVKEQKVTDIKRQRLLLKEVGRQKLMQIHDMNKLKEEQTTGKMKMLEEMHNDYKKEKNLTTVIQNLFQAIIIGSRVNWAEDPYLKAIVLQLEKNI
ncbi:centromere protein H [Strigops habroptila]|uniref:Centromere protein H n=1 Tax=Strigops habroptila TaxID=2489341 RepID=A0A672V4Y7_STRHB|nr:centromere protein H [Strigops habroptila]